MLQRQQTVMLWFIFPVHEVMLLHYLAKHRNTRISFLLKCSITAFLGLTSRCLTYSMLLTCNSYSRCSVLPINLIVFYSVVFYAWWFREAPCRHGTVIFFATSYYANLCVCVRAACAAICYNCATLNATTCQCSCADGWHGVDCSGEWLFHAN